MVTSEEALLEPLTTGAVTAATGDVEVALDPDGDAPNITGSVRDNRGFITTLWGDGRVTIVDDMAGFTDRTVKRRRLIVTITPRRLQIKTPSSTRSL